ncbi:hypothetical protein [Moorena sp. SIO4G3]|nr:hypothetical protein [Moorena sp. SIO4G3]
MVWSRFRELKSRIVYHYQDFSRFLTPDSRLPIPNSRFPIPAF